MLPAHGLYGHIRNTAMRSLLLFAGFLVTLSLLWAVLEAVWILTAPLLAELTGVIVIDEAMGNFDRLCHEPFAMIAESLWVPFAIGLVWLFSGVSLQAWIIRLASGAKGIRRSEAPRLFNIVENLALQAGIPAPRIEVIETSALNAYAAGLRPADATVAVTRGLVDGLDARELEAVLAHEITHIRNDDTRLSVVALVLQGLMSELAELIWSTITRHKLPLVDIFMTRAQNSDDQRSRFLAFLYWHALVVGPLLAEAVIPGAGAVALGMGLASLLVLAVRAIHQRAMGLSSGCGEQLGYLPTLKLLLVLPLWLAMVAAGFVAAVCYALSCKLTGAISRSREFLADAGAVELTKDPDALVSALRKIGGRDVVPGVGTAMLGLMISSGRSGWLATHPSIEARIAALQAFGGAVRASVPIAKPAVVRAPVPVSAAGRTAFGRRGSTREPAPPPRAT